MFSLFRRSAPEVEQDSNSAKAQLLGAAAQGMEHVQALADLFSTELQEYLQLQRKRTLFMVLAAVLLFGSYELLCALVAVLLEPEFGLAGALSLVLFLNLAAAVVLLWRAAATGNRAVAPATRRELANDWQCLKLLIKEKQHS